MHDVFLNKSLAFPDSVMLWASFLFVSATLACFDMLNPAQFAVAQLRNARVDGSKQATVVSAPTTNKVQRDMLHLHHTPYFSLSAAACSGLPHIAMHSASHILYGEALGGVLKTGVDWVQCICTRWLHEECILDCIIDSNGKERLCLYCT